MLYTRQCSKSNNRVGGGKDARSAPRPLGMFGFGTALILQRPVLVRSTLLVIFGDVLEVIRHHRRAEEVLREIGGGTGAAPVLRGRQSGANNASYGVGDLREPSA